MVALTRSRSGAVVRAPQRYEPDPDTVFEDDDSTDDDDDCRSDDEDSMSSDGDDTLSDDFIVHDDEDAVDQDVALRDAVDSCLVYWTHGSDITPENVASWLDVAARRMVTPLPDRDVLIDALQSHVASSSI
jgi:hypothetical protein